VEINLKKGKLGNDYARSLRVRGHVRIGVCVSL